MVGINFEVLSVMTRVVHRYREAYDIYIGRGSKWGNPFVIGRDGNRIEVINKYREWIIKQEVMKDLGELEGKVLGCYCAPLKCHGDVLVELLASRKLEEILDDELWP